MYSQGSPAGQSSVQQRTQDESWEAFVSSNTAASLHSVVSQQEALESLVSSEKAARLNAARQLDNRRRELIPKLMEILKSTNSDEVKAGAVIVLGQYRASEAASLLVHHFEWDETRQHDYQSGHILIEEDLTPVTSALTEIGQPAIEPLLERIVETDDTKITVKCVHICHYIEGLDVTQFRLQELLGAAPDNKKKERIQSALNLVNNWKALAAGPRGISEMLGKIAETDDGKMTSQFLIRLRLIEGRQMTQFRLQGLLQKETDPRRKGRIQSALDGLKE